MLTLRSSLPSPFGRKVKIAAHLAGLTDRINVVLTDTTNPDDPLRRDNPLGKIPCLVLEDGTALYDSRVIIEWIDHEAGGGVVIPKEWPARIAALKMQALADGLMDAGILQVYENRFRKPEMHDANWLAYQAGKIERGLALLEADPPKATSWPHIGIITLVCALDWLEFRLKVRSMHAYPRLEAFLAEMYTALPALAETKPRV